MAEETNEVAVMERRLAVLGHVVVEYEKYCAMQREIESLRTDKVILLDRLWKLQHPT